MSGGRASPWRRLTASLNASTIRTTPVADNHIRPLASTTNRLPSDTNSHSNGGHLRIQELTATSVPLVVMPLEGRAPPRARHGAAEPSSAGADASRGGLG